MNSECSDEDSPSPRPTSCRVTHDIDDVEVAVFDRDQMKYFVQIIYKLACCCCQEGFQPLLLLYSQ
jgi:hypothetical protein